MTRKEALTGFAAISDENSEIGDCVFEILSFLEGSSYNSAEAFLSADRLYAINWNRREKKIRALNTWYAAYIEQNENDFDVWDAKQSADFSMPDAEYIKNVLRRWESRRI